MTAAPALTLPGGRVVLGWWRDFSGLQPHRLWFAHLLLHRVEVLVEVISPAPLAGLSDSLLALLARQPSPFLIDPLAAELQLDRGLLTELLRDLAGEGLVRPVGGSHADEWEVNPRGGADSPVAKERTRKERR